MRYAAAAVSVRTVTLPSSTQSTDLGVTVAQLTSFGEGPLGGLYMISRTGTISRLQAAR